MHTNIEPGRMVCSSTGAAASETNSRRFSTLDLSKLRHASDFHPLADEDVAGVIEPRAVRRDELARLELASIRRDAQLILPAGVRAVAKVRDHRVALVV